MKYVSALLVRLLVLMLGMGCDDELQPPKNVRAYSLLVCGLEPPPDGATWKDVHSRVRGQVNTLENIVPPPEVYDFHFSNLAFARAALEFVADKDGNARANYYELDDPHILRVGAAHQEAIDALATQPLHTLRVAGCDA